MSPAEGQSQFSVLLMREHVCQHTFQACFCFLVGIRGQNCTSRWLLSCWTTQSERMYVKIVPDIHFSRVTIHFCCFVANRYPWRQFLLGVYYAPGRYQIGSTIIVRNTWWECAASYTEDKLQCIAYGTYSINHKQYIRASNCTVQYDNCIYWPYGLYFRVIGHWLYKSKRALSFAKAAPVCLWNEHLEAIQPTLWCTLH